MAGTPDRDAFLASGARHAAVAADLAAAHGAPLGPGTHLLDLGCGCGRLLRHWTGTGATLAGADRTPELADWVAAHLPVEARATAPDPPTPWPDGAFDVIVAYSVLTHLPVAAQRAWAAEWARLLRPGGVALVTTHGENRRADLDPAGAGAFAAGRPVVVHPRAAGDNLCRTYLPPAAAADLFRPLAVRAHHPAGEDGMARWDQDWWVLAHPR